jgi:regulator of nucleoside diphosphate kinase
MLPLPAIALTASDYPRLEQTARAAARKGDLDATFLLAEINRVEIVPSDVVQVSVLSGLGAALLGLRAGDQMPYFVAGCMNVIRIETVNRAEPRIDPLAPLLRASTSPTTMTTIRDQQPCK